MMALLRALRTLHGWMGIIAIPWVLIYGLTGLFLNHENSFGAIFPADTVDQFWSEDAPGRLPTEDSARAWFGDRFPGLEVKQVFDEAYHGKSAFVFDAGVVSVIMPKNSSFYLVKDTYSRNLMNADGVLLHRHLYWPRMLKELHVRGWIKSPVGTTIADVFSVILICFGLTGMILWASPRLRKLKTRLLSRQS